MYMIEPTHPRTMPDVMIGNTYKSKLHKMIEQYTMLARAKCWQTQWSATCTVIYIDYDESHWNTLVS